ncbi:MAG: hypothetical protein HFG00_08220 [Oscillibacter sp.]|nr:hypothetical protein [Oscillibacter sp.]
MKQLKQRRRIPWKRMLLGGLVLYTILLFFVEYFWIALFLLAVMGIAALWMAFDFWKDRRRSRQTAKQREAETCRQTERRRSACREAQYCPEERELVEACIEVAFGPIVRWDREETGKALPVDIALIAPSGSCPGWRAVTVGAGACALERERGELALLLPPDWSGEVWPLRLLRETVQSLLVNRGGFGPGSSYQSGALFARGFAGTVLLESLGGRYPLEPLELYGGEVLWFSWLLPLLKPEWDYLQARGVRALRERLADMDLAADSSREGCVNAETWFAEDLAPFVWSEDEGNFCLGLDTRAFLRQQFLAAGLTGTGWDWERLVRTYLRRTRPEDVPFVEFACEEWVFFAASEDAEILRTLGLGLRDFLRWSPEEALGLIALSRKRGRV